MQNEPANVPLSARVRYDFRDTDLITLNGTEYVRHSADDTSVS